MITETPNNSKKWAADMTVEELQVELAEMNHEVINFNQSYADKMKYNGQKATRRQFSSLAMRRKAVAGNTYNGGRK